MFVVYFHIPLHIFITHVLLKLEYSPGQSCLHQSVTCTFWHSVTHSQNVSFFWSKSGAKMFTVQLKLVCRASVFRPVPTPGPHHCTAVQLNTDDLFPTEAIWHGYLFSSSVKVDASAIFTLLLARCCVAFSSDYLHRRRVRHWQFCQCSALWTHQHSVKTVQFSEALIPYTLILVCLKAALN